MEGSYDLSHQISRLHKFAEVLKLRNFHIAEDAVGGFFAGIYAARYPDEIISVGLFDAVGVHVCLKPGGNVTRTDEIHSDQWVYINTVIDTIRDVDQYWMPKK
jgi:pimeloyl-ACP methyl ester carboxylesterase